MREKYQTEIEKRISEFERDYAFTAVDFADIAVCVKGARTVL